MTLTFSHAGTLAVYYVQICANRLQTQIWFVLDLGSSWFILFAYMCEPIHFGSGLTWYGSRLGWLRPKPNPDWVENFHFNRKYIWHPEDRKSDPLRGLNHSVIMCKSFVCVSVFFFFLIDVSLCVKEHFYPYFM